MTDSFRKKLIVAALLIVVVVAAYALWTPSGNGDIATANGQSQRAIPIRAAAAEQQDVTHWINAVGTVEPLHRVIVRAQVEGLLTEVLFDEGQVVERGQVLAKIDDRVLRATLRSAEADLISNESQLRNAALDLQRYRNLAQSNAISKQVLDQQEALVEQLNAEANRDKAAIEDARVRLSYTTILSPITGRVGIRKVDAGNFVRVSDAEGIVTVTQMDPISVLFSLPQTSLPALQEVLQEAGQAQVKVMQRQSGQELTSGTVSAIDTEIRPGSGTVQIRAQFDNNEEALWPGQFVAVRVPVGHSKEAVVVPAVALRLGRDGNYVYRLVEGDTVELVPVRSGYHDEATGLVVVEDGLSAGDQVVTDGFVRLRPGAKVRVQSSGGTTLMAAADASAQPQQGDVQP